MKLLVTGICGFVGSSVCEGLVERCPDIEITGIDNLSRPGSEGNRTRLQKFGIRVVHGDVRAASDFEDLPPADWVIDAAANPSVLAGLQGCTSRQIFEHNLAALGNVLEFCKGYRAGLVLLSSSRIYSIAALEAVPLRDLGDRFALDTSAELPAGLTERGIGVEFSTQPPVSLYGSTKLASEILALEYGLAFDFPVWINRCGVLAGAGQFGRPDQGIFAYWINAHLRRRPLRYTGFGGTGRQVRDALHPHDLAALLATQMACLRKGGERIYTLGGGRENAMSLAQLTAWCDSRFGCHTPQPASSSRLYDVPWIVMNSEIAEAAFDWSIQIPIGQVLEGIACHAESHPDWLERSGA